jgi:hypothetical protein
MNPFSGKVNLIPANRYLPELTQLQGDFYFHGYWINKEWFTAIEDTLRSELVFPDIDDEVNRNYLKQIKETDSLSVHIRRGDYVTLGWNWDNDFYFNLMKKAAFERPQAVLFVFSDDIDFCMEHAKELGLEQFREIVYVSGNTDNGKNYRDMQLMSQCRGMIMSNSAFCYLAALLNTRKDYVLNITKREV